MVKGKTLNIIMVSVLVVALVAVSCLYIFGVFGKQIEKFNKALLGVGAGTEQGFGIDKDGNLYGWGKNDKGQLGDGSYSNKSSPTKITLGSENNVAGVGRGVLTSDGDEGGGLTFIAVSSAATHTIAIDSQGDVWGWGFNNAGRLMGSNDLSPEGTDNFAPTKIPGLEGKNIKFVVAGLYNNLAIDGDGFLWSWGNAFGYEGSSLGLGELASTVYPQAPAQITSTGSVTFTTASIGNGFSLALDTDGNVWVWGRNTLDGVLGNGAYWDQTLEATGGNDYNDPVKLTAFDGNEIIAISAGASHSLAVDINGNVWAWGSNAKSQLGQNGVVKNPTPQKLTIDAVITSVGAGSEHSVALDNQGKIWVWGGNASDCVLGLGKGAGIQVVTPTQLETEASFVEIAVGYWHTLAIDEDGNLWGFGDNSVGQLGDGTTGDKNVPTQLTFVAKDEA